jgi:hypothetical protein
MGKLDNAMAAARRAGAGATQVARVQAYGTRRDPAPNASEAFSSQAAIGIGPRSVWNGPRRAARPGEPVLRRAKG